MIAWRRRQTAAPVEYGDDSNPAREDLVDDPAARFDQLADILGFPFRDDATVGDQMTFTA